MKILQKLDGCGFSVPGVCIRKLTVFLLCVSFAWNVHAEKSIDQLEVEFKELDEEFRSISKSYKGMDECELETQLDTFFYRFRKTSEELLSHRDFERTFTEEGKIEFLILTVQQLSSRVELTGGSRQILELYCQRALNILRNTPGLNDKIQPLCNMDSVLYLLAGLKETRGAWAAARTHYEELLVFPERKKEAMAGVKRCDQYLKQVEELNNMLKSRLLSTEEAVLSDLLTFDTFFTDEIKQRVDSWCKTQVALLYVRDARPVVRVYVNFTYMGAEAEKQVCIEALPSVISEIEAFYRRWWINLEIIPFLDLKLFKTPHTTTSIERNWFDLGLPGPRPTWCTKQEVGYPPRIVRTVIVCSDSSSDGNLHDKLFGDGRYNGYKVMASDGMWGFLRNGSRSLPPSYRTLILAHEFGHLMGFWHYPRFDVFALEEVEKGNAVFGNLMGVPHDRGRLEDCWLEPSLAQMTLRPLLERYEHLDLPYKAPPVNYAAIRYALKERDFALANRVLKFTFEEFPDDPVAWNLQGVLHYECKDLNKARAAFEKSIELGGNAMRPAMSNLGSLALADGDNAEALKWYFKANVTEKVAGLYSQAVLLDLYSKCGNVENVAETVRILDRLRRSKSCTELRHPVDFIFETTSESLHKPAIYFGTGVGESSAGDLMFRIALGHETPEIKQRLLAKADEMDMGWYRRYCLGNLYLKDEKWTEANRCFSTVMKHSDEFGKYKSICDWQVALVAGRYEKGDGLPEDKAKAKFWYKAAYDWYHRAAYPEESYLDPKPEAFRFLGHLYDKGRGVPENPAKAVELYRKGAEAGDTACMYYLAWNLRAGRGVAKDLSAAINWFRRSAEAGDSDSMHQIAMIYRDGTGVEQSYTESLKWSRRAAEAGNARGINEVAWILVSIPELANGREALEWALKATAGAAPDEKSAYLDTLACAYAETGDFHKAVETEKQAMELTDDPELKKYLQEMIGVFEKGMTYIEYQRTKQNSQGGN